MYIRFDDALAQFMYDMKDIGVTVQLDGVRLDGTFNMLHMYGDMKRMVFLAQMMPEEGELSGSWEIQNGNEGLAQEDKLPVNIKAPYLFDTLREWARKHMR